MVCSRAHTSPSMLVSPRLALRPVSPRQGPQSQLSFAYEPAHVAGRSRVEVAGDERGASAVLLAEAGEEGHEVPDLRHFDVAPARSLDIQSAQRGRQSWHARSTNASYR